MPVHHFAVVDGRRVDTLKLETVTEFSCDSCGRFVSKPVIVQGQLFIESNGPVHLQEFLCSHCYANRHPQLALDHPAPDNAR